MPTAEVIDIEEISEGLEDMDAEFAVQFEDGPSTTIIDFSKVLCPSILSKPISEIVPTSFFEDLKASFHHKGHEDTGTVMVDNTDSFQLVTSILDDRYQFRSVEFVHIEKTTKAPFLRRMYNGEKIEWAYSKVFTNANKLMEMNDPYGKHYQNMGKHCFGPDSEFLCHLIFFFDASNLNGFSVLVESGLLLLSFVHDNGDAIELFAGLNYPPNHSLVAYILKQFSFACIRAIYRNGNQLKAQLMMITVESTAPTNLLQALPFLLDPKLLWAETTSAILSLLNCSFEIAIDIAAVTTILLDTLSLVGYIMKYQTIRR